MVQFTDRVVQLAHMRYGKREDQIMQDAHIWVSEHEGYNSIEFDRMCEAKEDEIWQQVYAYMDYAGIPEEDPAHEADMAELRKEQLEADGPWDDELVDDYED